MGSNSILLQTSYWLECERPRNYLKIKWKNSDIIFSTISAKSTTKSDANS